MKFIDLIISFSTVKHPSERTIFELGFKKELKQKSHLIEIQIFSHSCHNWQFSICFNVDIGSSVHQILTHYQL